MRNPAQELRPRPEDVPADPGCYLWRDAAGRVLYVGKAKSLRARLSSYFGAWSGLGERTRAMLQAAADVEWIVTSNEVEALHLEFNLIKRHRPRYNVRYTDDKSYPYLAITVQDEYPRAMVRRNPRKDGTRYFGPYAHAYAIRETLDLLLRVFPVRTCSDGVFERCRRTGRPSLNHHIGRCAAPCVGKVSAAEHRALVDDLIAFLEGDTDRTLRALEERMHAEAAEQNFEAAARLRDQLGAVRRALEKQTMATRRQESFAAVHLHADELQAAVQVFFVRGGRVVGRKGWSVDKVEALETPALLGRFLVELAMEQGSELAPEILVPELPDDLEALQGLLAEQRGRTVRVRVPQRGEKRAFLETVRENAVEAFGQQRLRRARDFNARSQALQELQEALGLAEAPLRIECYDVSTLQGSDGVASMVVLEDGLPRKSDYRHFRIKGVAGQDDVAMLREALLRRLRRLHRDASEPPTRFAYPPNLIVVDGGKPQLGAAQAALAEAGVDDIPVCALAKRLEEIYLPGRQEPVRLPRGTEALHLLQRVRDEAHRFAVRYHRTLRGKRATASVLEEIPGVGPARRQRLIAHFGSLDRLRQASPEELAAVPGISTGLAETIRAHLHGAGADGGVAVGERTRGEQR